MKVHVSRGGLPHLHDCPSLFSSPSDEEEQSSAVLPDGGMGHRPPLFAEEPGLLVLLAPRTHLSPLGGRISEREGVHLCSGQCLSCKSALKHVPVIGVYSQ